VAELQITIIMVQEVEVLEVLEKVKLLNALIQQVL
jgi:hypothetical protein